MKSKIIALLFLIVATLVGYLYFSSITPIEGQVRMSILESPVSVIRDKYGIPHIKANSKSDMYKALGFTMAQDRLFQMDILRRVGSGRLAEILGPKVVKYDVLLRKLKIKKFMDDYWTKSSSNQNPEMVSHLKSFLQGIHYFIDTQNLPIEFKLLNYKPDRFTIPELLSVSGYMALTFAEGLIGDPLFSHLKSFLSDEIVNDLRLKEREDRNRFVNHHDRFISHTVKDDFEKIVTDLLSFHDFFEKEIGMFHGSNSWVLSGARSESGFPLLANDPHIAFTNPSVWYEAYIESPDFNIYGHFIPLIPFPAIGHDKFRAWAVTMSEVDDLDIYLEKVHPDDRTRVLFNNEWVSLDIQKEVIKVRGSKDQEIEIITGPHGPFIDGTEYGKKGQHLSIKWSYHHPENNVALAFFKLGNSSQLSDLDEALKHAAAPGLNISWVDKKGNIAWRVMGKIPVREGFKGNEILDGSSGVHEYTRYLDIKENPGITNPDNGIIITANYYPQSQKLPFEGYWQPSERIERIDFLLNQSFKWDLEKLKQVQSDQVLGNANEINEILLREVENIEKTKLEEESYKLLAQWDGSSDVNSIASLIFHKTLFQIQMNSLVDDLGEESFKAFFKIADSQNFFKFFMKQNNHALWDNKTTPKNETRTEIIRSSFRESISILNKEFGPEPKNWKWGKAHTIEFEHFLGKVFPLNYLFNLGPFEVGGGAFQVDNMTHKRYEDGFKVALGPSTRRLIDMKDSTRSLGVLPTGNSGNVFSKHYKDQVPLFISNKYRPQISDFGHLSDSEELSSLLLTP